MRDAVSVKLNDIGINDATINHRLVYIEVILTIIKSIFLNIQNYGKIHNMLFLRKLLKYDFSI